MGQLQLKFAKGKHSTIPGNRSRDPAKKRVPGSTGGSEERQEPGSTGKPDPADRKGRNGW